MSLQSDLKRVKKKNKKGTRFLRTKMWCSVFVSKFLLDRGTIPTNIGNSIMIGNNQYVTKNSISVMFLVEEFSETTPVAFMSLFLKEIKTKVSGVRVDFTIKNRRYYPDLTSGGLNSRIKQWENTLDSEITSEKSKKRAARLLYTVDVAHRKEKMYYSSLYIQLRGDNGTAIAHAQEVAKDILNRYNILYKVISSDIETHLKYISLLSNKRTNRLRDFGNCVMSATTLAEILPQTQGLNSLKGSFMGINRINRTPYLQDWMSSSGAKNIGVVGGSGDGKTFLVQANLLDDYAIGYNLCICDMKGTEFTTLTKACGGVILSMRRDSKKYVNTFRLRYNPKVDTVTYYNDMLGLSRQQMIFMANMPPEKEPKVAALIEEFLSIMYNSLGVTVENPNTWVRTEPLNPYVVYDKFVEFSSKHVRERYSDIFDDVNSGLKMYMSRTGTNSHMFLEEYSLEEIKDKRVVTFDFGMFNSSQIQDESMFKLKLLYMNLINSEYSAYKKSLGQWTAKVLEEAQLAQEYLMKIYAEEFSLRRAQNQKTYLLTNSLTAIVNRPEARPIIDNMTMLLIGNVTNTTRKYLVEEFGLEQYEEKIERLSSDSDYEHTFLLINKTNRKPTHALIKAYIPDSVADGSLFKTVDTEEADMSTFMN